jgi:hypothetical protein
MVLRRPEAGHNLHMTTPLVAAESLRALGSSDRRLDAYASHEIALGALTVSRALPVKGRRMIGPWCFLDRFGPLSFTAGLPMDVAPHPHMGLQTVTWLLEGEVVHDDSLRQAPTHRGPCADLRPTVSGPSRIRALELLRVRREGELVLGRTRPVSSGWYPARQERLRAA